MSPKRSAWSSSTHALLEQLEHGEEADDHLEPLDERGGQAAERDAPDAGQLVDQLGDGVGDADPDRGDVEQVDRRHRLGRERAGSRRRAGARGVSAGEQVGGQPGEALVGADLAREAAVGVVGERAEQPGDVLERLALEQPGEQQVALLPQGQLVVEVDVVRGRAAGGGP